MLINMFNNIESVLCRLFLATFVTLLFVQIVSRQIFGYSFSWIEELSIYLFVWFAYFGASYAALKSAHNRVTFQFKNVSHKTRMTFTMIADGLWIFFNAYFLWMAYKFVFFRMNKFWTSQTLDIQMKWVYLVLPITFALMTIRIIQVNYRQFILHEEIEDVDKVECEQIRNLKDPESEN